MAEINLQKICDIANVDIVASLKYALNSVTNCYGFIEDLQEILNDEFDHDAIKTRKVYDYLYRGLVDSMIICPDLFDEVDLMADEKEEVEDPYEKHFRRFK